VRGNARRGGTVELVTMTPGSPLSLWQRNQDSTLRPVEGCAESICPNRPGIAGGGRRRPLLAWDSSCEYHSVKRHTRVPIARS